MSDFISTACLIQLVRRFRGDRVCRGPVVQMSSWLGYEKERIGAVALTYGPVSGRGGRRQAAGRAKEHFFSEGQWISVCHSGGSRAGR